MLEAFLAKDAAPQCTLRAGFFFFFGKGWVEFGYIVFGLNEFQWVFS